MWWTDKIQMKWCYHREPYILAELSSSLQYLLFLARLLPGPKSWMRGKLSILLPKTPAQHYTMSNFDMILSGDEFLVKSRFVLNNSPSRALNNMNLHFDQTRLHQNASLCTRPTQRYRRSFRVALHISFTQHCATVKWAVLYRKYFLQVSMNSYNICIIVYQDKTLT